MAQIIGTFRLGRDAEVRYLQDGTPVANLALAFNYGKKGDDGNRPSQWIDASMFGARADALAPYLLKGAQIYAVLNDPHIQTYEGKNGQGHKLVARLIEIELVGGRTTGQTTAPAQQPRPQGEAYRQAKEGRTPMPAQQRSSGFDDMENDAPF